jgi:hypothetical protein
VKWAQKPRVGKALRLLAPLISRSHDNPPITSLDKDDFWYLTTTSSESCKLHEEQENFSIQDNHSNQKGHRKQKKSAIVARFYARITGSS